MPDAPPQSLPPLRSRFAEDPEMAELVDLFVSELPEKIIILRTAFERREGRLLARIAHQLRGAADGYGFASITEAAAAVEVAVVEGPGVEGRLEAVRAQVDELVELCVRASRARP